MSSWRLDIAYDGGGFRGWAKQPGQRTLQAELEQALSVVLRREVSLTVAGRTDAGVHAWRQVASFELDDANAAEIRDDDAAEIHDDGTAESDVGGPGTSGPTPARLMRGLNALTPPQLAVTAVERVPRGFNARRDALARRYCYRIDTGSPPNPFELGRALWWAYPLDREALAACAELLEGTHDFTAFTPTKTEHVRFERNVFEAYWSEQDPESSILSFWIEADSFMRSMVRALVGTMLEVGGGRRTVADFADLLAGAPRSAAGETAPPHGLYLASVRY